MSVLPPWTLSAHLDGAVLEFSLGDGRRLSWRSRRSAQLLQPALGPLSAADFLGADLAARLESSATRLLHIQYEAAELDAVAWEQLGLGARTLGQSFALGRQLVTGVESASALEAMGADPLGDSLKVTLIHGHAMPAVQSVRSVALADLDQDDARSATLAAHVLVLHAATPDQLIDLGLRPQRPSLWVLRSPELQRPWIGALDAGAAVLLLDQERDPNGASLDFLSQQLGNGVSVGDAVRGLHRRNGSADPGVRLYGDPALRFVREHAPTSRRQVTSLSFDLVGSTTLLRHWGDEAYAEMLASLHDRCTDVVRRLGGQPDDPQGNDGVMCYFGHPTAMEHAAVRAVEAGLLIIDKVAELGVSVRVGIATGLVAIKAGQPVGLSIHLAARLQQVTAPGTVLTSESTRRLVAHAFELKALDERPGLKGIDELEDFYQVIGPNLDANRHRSEQGPATAPLVGRRRELEQLNAAWRRACEGKCCLAVVRAEAGMGKSRLVREFRRQLADGGVKVLESRCRPDASASPYLTLAEALRRWLDIGPDTPMDEAVHRLADTLPAKARESESLGILAAFLGLAPPPALAAPASHRQRLLGLLLEWLVVFAKDRPCCLVVEDWHWVDPSMREFVEHIAQHKGGSGLLVVVTIRGDAAPAPLAFEQSEQIELSGLAPEEARELINHVCAGTPLPTEVLRTLAARGDGVPLFLEEAARMALSRGVARLGTELRAEDSVPASLQDLLMARLDGLGQAKSVAQVAAVIGREFSMAMLSALMETGPLALDASTLAERLDALLGSGLVRSEVAGHFAFRHALIRDAAYVSLWTRDRHALHARMVHLLQQRWPEQAALQPELLALHQTEAGLHSDALAQWELAASSASSRSAELEAISHLRRALAILPRTEPGIDQDRTALRLHLLLAARLIATEGYGAESVLQAYLEAERLGSSLGDESVRFKVEMGLEAYRFMRADFGLALEHGQRAAAIAQRSGDIKQQLHAHWGLACTLFHQGKLRATMREMDTALAAYSPALHAKFGIQDPGVMCMAYSSWGLWEMARPDAALARINQAVGVANEYKHRFSQAVALAYGVSIELLRGETDLAMIRAERCIQVCENGGFPVWLAITRCMRGRLLCERGEFDEGLRDMRAGYAQWLSTGAQVSQPLYLALQAEGLMLAGDLGEAASCVNQGLAITRRFGERQLEAELCRLSGEVALLNQDLAQAEHLFKTAYALALRQHKLGFALRAATALAHLWLQLGRPKPATRLLLPLVARWQEGLQTRDLKKARALCDELQAHV